MYNMEKDIESILLTEEQIKSKVKELGAILTEEYADKNPIVVGALKGVVMFYADMMRELKMPCQMDFIWISSYSGATSTGKMVVRQENSADLKGRHVLILEDIFDTGNSLSFLVNTIWSKEPASVKVCTFLDKPERRNPGVTLKADYVGYTIPNAFVVGYGLDYNEKYRNLPYIGILKPEVYTK